MSKPLAHMTDAELRDWATAALTKLSSAPLTWGITVETVDEFGELTGAYVAAYQAAVDDQTRGKSTIFAKSQKRESLLEATAKMIRQIQASPLVTDQMRSDLGISVRREPSPIPTPSTSPWLIVEQTVARRMTVRTNGAKGSKLKRPPGVRGIALYSAVSPTEPPVGSPLWKHEGNTSAHVVDVEFPADVPNGSTVWFCAFFIGSRLESGPVSLPISAVLPGTPGGVAEAGIKLAA